MYLIGSVFFFCFFLITFKIIVNTLFDFCRSYGVVLWELLTCEAPYKDVDSSAIIWGVGSNSLHLPIPSSCPEGFKLLITQCWSAKPRNRPSFRHILLHLETASPYVLNMSKEEWFRMQVCIG